MTMAPITMVIGLMLIAVGLVGFIGTGSTHYTALIPAGFGVVILLLGALALNERWRKHAMHAASAIGLLGFLGSALGAYSFLQWMLLGTRPDRPEAALAQALMALICFTFVGLCINSFIQARRARRAREGLGEPGNLNQPV
jgi:hypothetical protein